MISYFIRIGGIIFSLCFYISTNAQFAKIELGQLSTKYKDYQECDFSPGSGAVVLNKEGVVSMTRNKDVFKTSYLLHKVVKILNKDGLDAANFEFTTFGKVSYIKAATFNEVDGEWEASFFDQESLYEEWIGNKKNYKNYKIPMPNVSKGSIIELIIEIEYIYYGASINQYVPSWYFQEGIPVLFSSYTICHYSGMARRINLELKSNSIDVQLLSSNENEFNVDYFEKDLGRNVLVKKYSATKIPPIILNENFVIDPLDNISQIKYLSPRYLSSSFRIDRVKKAIRKLLIHPGFSVIPKHKSLGLIAKLGVDILEEDSERDIAKKIYQKIQTNIVSSDSESIIPGNTPLDIIEKGKGRIADINMLFIHALREADIEANPLALSTRNDLAPKTIDSNSDELNYLVCLVKVDGKEIILDASKQNLPFGLLPVYALAEKGIILDYENASWVLIRKFAKHEETFVVDLKIEENNLKGTVQSKLNNYAASNFHIADKKEAIKEEFKSNLSEGWNWDNTEFLIDDNIPVIIKSDISKEIELDDVIYIQPSIFKIFNENPFKNKKRFSPVDMPYQVKYKLLFNLEIPDGYFLEEAPLSNKVIIPGNIADFIYVVEKKKNNKVSINISFHLKKVSYNLDEYEMLHDFFRRVYEQLENVIVLKKK